MNKKRIAILLGLLLIVGGFAVISGRSCSLRNDIIRSARSPGRGYWGNGRTISRQFERLSLSGNRLRLLALMDDADKWIRFLAAHSVLQHCGGGVHPRRIKSGESLGHGRIVPSNGYTEAEIQHAFEILEEGFLDTDPATRGRRSWAADHFPTYCDVRVVRVLATAVSQDMIGIHFGEMDLCDLTGKDRAEMEGGMWLQWLNAIGSNIVWNGHFFEDDSNGAHITGPTAILRNSCRLSLDCNFTGPSTYRFTCHIDNMGTNNLRITVLQADFRENNGGGTVALSDADKSFELASGKRRVFDWWEEVKVHDAIRNGKVYERKTTRLNSNPDSGGGTSTTGWGGEGEFAITVNERTWVSVWFLLKVTGIGDDPIEFAIWSDKLKYLVQNPPDSLQEPSHDG